MGGFVQSPEETVIELDRKINQVRSKLAFEEQLTKVRNYAFYGALLIPALFVATVLTHDIYDLARINWSLGPLALLAAGLVLAVEIRARRRGPAAVSDLADDLRLLMEQRELRMAQYQLSRHLQRVYYRQGVIDEIHRLRAKSDELERQAGWMQITIVGGALLTTTLAGGGLALSVLRWITVFSSLAVGIVAAINGHYKPAQVGALHKHVAQAFEDEVISCEQGIGAYAELEPEEALKRFVERVQEIRIAKRELEETTEPEERPNIESAVR
jgi:Protein of unknown function (DUF4231)